MGSVNLVVLSFFLRILLACAVRGIMYTVEPRLQYMQSTVVRVAPGVGTLEQAVAVSVAQQPNGKTY